MIDLGVLYLILSNAARRGEIISYTELSVRYHRETAEDHHPHGTWDVPLGQLNGHTHSAGLPAISAVVTYKVNEDDPDSQFVPPGDNFWGTPGVPPRPATAGDREMTWL